MYSISIEEVLTTLEINGFAKLPSIQNLIQENEIYEKFINENKNKTYNEGSLAHLHLIKLMNLEKLFKALYIHGKNLWLKIIENDKYFIARHIKNGQKKEGYRGHFDSHFITIVLPILIPQKTKCYSSGELFLAPNFRSHTSNEIVNIIQKAYYKKINKHDNYVDLIEKGIAYKFDFSDYQPIIFYGNRAFHGNFPLNYSPSDRITFLCHLFDTSPKYSIGALLRLLRNR